MTLEHDFDPELARRLDVRLASYAPVGRIPQALPRQSRRGLALAVALAAILATSIASLGYEINASAESAGLGCLHPIAKIQLYAQGITGTAHDGDHSIAIVDARQQHAARDSHEACHH